MRLATIVEDGRPRSPSCATATVSCRSTDGRPGSPDPRASRRGGPDGARPDRATWVDAPAGRGAVGRSTTSRSARPCRTRARSTRSASTTDGGRAPTPPARAAARSTARPPASVAGHGATLAWDRVADRERRCRVRARRRHRRDRRSTSRRGRDGPRLRLHLHQRRLVARRVARRRPVAARQVDAGLLPGRPVDRHRRRARPGRPAASAARSTASPIQDGRTSQMRFSIAEVIAYLSRHVTLRPGRPHRHRHAGPARRRRSARTAISSPATS